jgi:predicted dehydrogenase
MPNRINRRDFIKTASVAAAAGYWVAARTDRLSAAAISPNEKLNIAQIGTNNQAAYDLKHVSMVETANIVAICDVDEKLLGATGEKFPKAKLFVDFRKMLDEMDKSIDAVVCACPNHLHAVTASAAMHRKKHVYVEKPLCHTVKEVRTLTELAKQMGVVTQMGTQIHAEPNYRRVVEIVKSGAIGPVSEVHIYCDKTHSAPPPMPTVAEPVPEGLHYDLWVGPAPFRPYNSAWLPAKWRRYWVYGDGTLGDMACHYKDLAFWALDLKYPTKIWAEGPKLDPECCPHDLTVHWQYPARGQQPAVQVSWYDGGRRPPKSAEWGLDEKIAAGVVFVGSKGVLFADYTQHKLLPEKQFAGFVPPPKSIPDSIGHHREWVEACRKNDPSATLCHFDYSGPLSEAVLLGNVAYRSGKSIEWDAKTMQIANAPEAAQFLQYEYRKGWTL